jgi:hypothetical protein
MKAAFPEIERIRFEGTESKNPLAFRHYNADEKVGGKTMRDHLRFSVVYWHTFRNPLSDPFGPGTAVRPWEDGTDSVEKAQNRARVAFEFAVKTVKHAHPTASSAPTATTWCSGASASSATPAPNEAPKRMRQRECAIVAVSPINTKTQPSRFILIIVLLSHVRESS